MRIILLGLVVIALVAVTLFSGVLPGGDGILSQRVLPDGSQILVAQKHSTSDLGYEVGFYYRTQNSEWGWCYLAHDDTRWRSARIEFDAAANTVFVWRGATLRGRLNRNNSIWERPDIQGWTTKAPQEMRKPPFEANKEGEQVAPPNGP